MHHRDQVSQTKTTIDEAALSKLLERQNIMIQLLLEKEHAKKEPEGAAPPQVAPEDKK